MSGDLIEAIWETLIALAIAAVICVGMISLLVHLQRLRDADRSRISRCDLKATRSCSCVNAQGTTRSERGPISVQNEADSEDTAIA
jgi:hypothetical protein